MSAVVWTAVIGLTAARTTTCCLATTERLFVAAMPSHRAQVLSGMTIYDASGNALVTNRAQALPTEAKARTIRLINETVAQGDDLLAGGAGTM